MSVRANWFAGAADTQLDDDGSDPFADVSKNKSPVSLESSFEDLQARQASLAKREARLFAMGMTCPLKERGECHCSACPISQLNHPEDGGISSLCKVGVEQERVGMLARAKDHPELVAAGGV